MAKPEIESSRFPAWAERQRASDLAWIAENLHILWPTAQTGYDAMGRGAVVVDIATVVHHASGSGHPMFYLPEEEIAKSNNTDALRMVRAYDPSGEFVTGLLKPQNRESFYRIQIPGQPPSMGR